MDTQETSPIDFKELLESSKKALITESQLIRIDEVSAITTLAKSTINLWVAKGKLIPPIALSSTIKVWKLQEITDWVEAQKGSQERSESQL
jgi:predicted DNA-binding transcriptional regulator AlpA